MGKQTPTQMQQDPCHHRFIDVRRRRYSRRRGGPTDVSAVVAEICNDSIITGRTPNIWSETRVAFLPSDAKLHSCGWKLACVVPRLGGDLVLHFYIVPDLIVHLFCFSGMHSSLRVCLDPKYISTCLYNIILLWIFMSCIFI